MPNDDDRIELNSLEALEKATVEGNRQVLEKLIADTIKFLDGQGVPRDRIAELATPAIYDAYSKWLTEYAEPGWAALERDIRGGSLH